MYGLNEANWVDILTRSGPVAVSRKFKNDSISINAHIKRNNWMIGEIVPIYLKISNISNKNLEISVMVYQNIKLSSPSYNKQLGNMKICKKVYKKRKNRKRFSRSNESFRN